MTKQLLSSCLLLVIVVFAWANEATNSVPNLTPTTQPDIQTTLTPLKNNQTTTLSPIPSAKQGFKDDDLNCTTLDNMLSCVTCVSNNCTYIQENDGGKCSSDPASFDQFTVWVSHNVTECQEHDNENTTTTSTTTTTTTTTTTVAPANTTTAPTTTTVPTTTSSTTSTTTTTKAPGPPTNTTTTASPTTAKTTTVGPTVDPSHKSGGWGWGPFFAGIVFTAGVSSVAYVVWRFYKARTERNYHTL